MVVAVIRAAMLPAGMLAPAQALHEGAPHKQEVARFVHTPAME